ncbi:MAG: pyrimidine 5'-nucleotidase [bacterium]|nr:pyrimidine 5'-nucleotidase [bacterium]
MNYFGHIKNWIFDLDNTLYPASCRLFDQIDKRMTQYVADFLGVEHDEAYALQKSYFRDFGTTMNGMMVNHQMDPEAYLHFVHDIDHSGVEEAPELARAIDMLPGRKMVFTNGSVAHAQAVMAQLGITDLFDTVHDIKASHYVPKPAKKTYTMMIEQTGVDPARAAMFEDIARNLEVPFELGMKTVLVRSLGDHADACAIDLGSGDEPYVDYATEDLADFLKTITT